MKRPSPISCPERAGRAAVRPHGTGDGRLGPPLAASTRSTRLRQDAFAPKIDEFLSSGHANLSWWAVVLVATGRNDSGERSDEEVQRNHEIPRFARNDNCRGQVAEHPCLMGGSLPTPVFPAKAGTQKRVSLIPAFAGKTGWGRVSLGSAVLRLFAGRDAGPEGLCSRALAAPLSQSSP